MIRLHRAILGGAALALAACAVAPEVTMPRMPPPRTERPTYQLGDRWIRHDGVFEVTGVLDDRYVFSNGDRVIHLSKDLVPFGWGRHGGEHGILDWNFGRAPALTWPLEVGARGTERVSRFSWEWQAPPWVRRVEQQSRSLTAPAWMLAPGGGHVARQYKAVIQPEDVEWTVEAYEEVRVPGGTFRAFRLLLRGEPSRPDQPGASAGWWLRTWYAPAVQQLVKAEGRGVGPLAFQMVAVDRDAPRPLQIVLDEPQDQARLTVGVLVLAGRVTAGKGVTRLTVSVNGRQILAHDTREAPKRVPLDLRVPLDDGKNVLLVTATDTAGETRQEARSVFYDARALRDAVDRARRDAAAARQLATEADAEQLARETWTEATAREQDAEAALERQDWERAELGFVDVRDTYQRAAREARDAAGLAEKAADARRARDAAAEARRAAEVADAPRLAATPWARARLAERDADSHLAREESAAAVTAFQQAERAYWEAEREATRMAAAGAAAERARLAALKRDLEAAEQSAAATAAARRAAEQAGAPRHAREAFAAALAHEQAVRAALERRDFAAAQARARDARQAFERATAAAQREAARLAARAEVEPARARAAEARRAADQADAPRLAPALRAAAQAKEQAADAALARQELPHARALFAEAEAAYRQSAEEARAAALPPVRMALSSPADQARLEQETVTLAGTLQSARGLRRVVVTRDAVEVARLEPPDAPRALALDLPVRLREGHNTLVVTATETDGSLAQEARTVLYEKPVPLTVAVRYPEDRARFTDESTVLAALVTSSRGIARVAVLLNGAEVHRQTERAPQKSLALAVPLTLRPGPNALVVTAVEPDGAVRQDVRTVLYERPKDAPLPPPPVATPAEPERWAVVIGIGAYESPDIPRLRYPVRDAEALYEVLVGPAGFRRDRVLLLTDATDRKPTLRHLKWALGTFLARQARTQDTVLIFFAGHGAPEPDPQGLEKDGLAKYLVPGDADPDDLYSTALPMDELQTIFGRIEAERVVAFLDTCYSGAAGGRTFAARRTRAGAVDAAFLDRLARARGRAIVTAARPNEVSLELPELGHGLFTYYLVRGLQGAADANRDGVIDLQELYQYVEREVTQRSRAAGGNQHPVMKGELEGMLPLIRVAPR